MAKLGVTVREGQLMTVLHGLKHRSLDVKEYCEIGKCAESQVLH